MKKNNTSEQFIRQQIRKILAESSKQLLTEDEFGNFATASDLYQTFVQPFTSVFAVAKTAFKDITSSTITTLRHSFSFDNDFRQKMAAKQRSDRDKYRQEYATVMKDINAALDSNDAMLLTFALNPGVFIGKAMATQALDAGEPIIDYAKEKMGMFSPELDSLYRDVQTTSNTGKGPIRGLLGDLNALFFGEGYNPRPLLEEEGEDSEEPVEVSEDEAIEMIVKAFDNSAFGKKLQADGDKLLTSKAAQLEEIKASVSGQMATLNQLVNANSIEEMQQPAQTLKTMGVDLSTQMQEVEALVNDAKTRLLGTSASKPKESQSGAGEKLPDVEPKETTKSPDKPSEEAQTMMDELRQTPDGEAIPNDAAPKDFIPLLEKGLIAAAFQGGISEARQELLQSTMDMIADDMKPEDYRDLAKTSPLGKKYSDLIMNFAKELATL